MLLSLIWIPHVGTSGQMLFTKDWTTQEGKDSNVHLFLKGQPGENYDDFFADSDTLIDAESRSDELCDLEGCRKLYSLLFRLTASQRLP